ncbi:hypothetical protein [Nostoc mirabile]|nr:hypothetical protein [Nostoc mirabile]
MNKTIRSSTLTRTRLIEAASQVFATLGMRDQCHSPLSYQYGCKP